MARNTIRKKDPQDDFAKELEQALELETASLKGESGDLDIAASIEDLENQISLAAEELAREGREEQTRPATVDSGEPAGKELPSETKAASLHQAEPAPAENLQRAEAEANGASILPLAANDDKRGESRRLTRAVGQRPPRTIYWFTAALSVFWIVAGIGLTNLFYGSQLSSVEGTLATPGAVALIVGIVVPVMLFWGFAIMIHRAQEMRLAAQQMAEVAFWLTEPENIAQDRVMMVGQAVRREVQAMGEGIERTLARAVELETLVHTEVNELERAYSENASRIRLLVDSLGVEREGIVSHAERVRASITGAHEVIKEELDAAGEHIRVNVDGASQRLAESLRQSGDTIADILDTRIASLGDTNNEFVERVGAASEKFNLTLDEKVESLSQRITTSGDGIASLLDTRITALTDRTEEATRTLGDLFDTRVSNLTTSVDEASDRMSGLFDTRLSELERTLAERGQALLSEFSIRAEALDTGIEKLESALEARARSINESLVERTREIAETFVRGREDVSGAIDAGKSVIEKDLSELVASTSTLLQSKADEFSGRLRDGHAEVSARLDGTLESFESLQARMDSAVAQQAEAFAQNQDRLAGILESDVQKLEDIHARFEGRIEGQLEQLAQTRNSFGDAIETDIAKLNEAFASQSGVIEERTRTMERALAVGVDNVRQTLEKSASVVAGALREKVMEATNSLSTETEKVLDGVDQRIIGRVENAAKTLGEQVETIDRTLDTAAQRITARADGFRHDFISIDERLSARLTEATEVLNHRAEGVARIFEEADQRIVARTHQTSAELDSRAASIAETLGEIEGRLRSTTDFTASTIEEKLSEIETRFQTTARFTTSSVESKLGEIESRLQSTADDAASAIADKLSEVEGRLQSTARFASSSVDSKLGEIESRLQSTADVTASAIADKLSEVEGRLQYTASFATSSVDSKLGEIESRLQSTADVTASAVAEKLGEIENRLQSTASVTTSAIVDGMLQVEQRLQASVGQTTTTLHAGLGEAEERLRSGAEQAAQHISHQLARSQADLVSTADTIGQTFAAINEHISKRTGESMHTLDERTRQFNTVLAERTADIGRILDETARPLVERFEASGGELQQSIEAITQQTEERLRKENAALVYALTNRTTETVKAMEHVRKTVTADVDQLISQLNASGSSLGDLVENAAKNLQQIDENLTRTTHSFAQNADKAAETFANSANLINANSGRLSEFSEKTLREISAISSRFEDHSRLLESASKLLEKAQVDLTGTLDGRREALEKLAGGLVEKSEQVEQVMKSFEGLLEGAFETAEDRTRKSAHVIREAINQVVDTATNRFAGATEDIRRSAAEIRAELEATRSDMKRGIVELPEEAKQSTTAMRRAVTEQINALRELSDIVAKSGRLHDVGTSVRPAEPVASTPRPAAPAANAVAVTTPPLQAAPQPAKAPATKNVAQTESQSAPAGGGWIRDLLRSASRDEDPAKEAKPANGQNDRSALHVVESLNSLSIDIARAIDHEASIELWERYRRGERNVFTRRLYTLKGQKTFDEIQRKYRADADFRKAVDQYCRDFEKLLADVSRSDRDNMMSQTYLTSDTGKVYTMLAHASGRLS